MPQSQSERIRANEDVTLTQLFVQPPPVPCPCIVRATGTNGEFAIAPIDLIGHPIEAIVSPDDGPLVELDLTVERRSAGLLGQRPHRPRRGDHVRRDRERAQHHHRAAHERRAAGQRRPPVERRRGACAVRSTRPHRTGPDVDADRRRRAARPPSSGGTRGPWSRAGAGPTVDAAAGTNAVPILLFVLGRDPPARPARARGAFDPARRRNGAQSHHTPRRRRARRRTGADVRRRT